MARKYSKKVQVTQICEVSIKHQAEELYLIQVLYHREGKTDLSAEHFPDLQSEGKLDVRLIWVQDDGDDLAQLRQSS